MGSALTGWARPGADGQRPQLVPGWGALRRRWLAHRLRDARFQPLLQPPPANEWVALDCETTGLDVRSDEIVSIGAVRIVGDRILTSERLELLVRPERAVSAHSVRIHRLRTQDLADGLPLHEAIEQLLAFIGSRPLVGYYLEFDVAMLNRAVRPLLGIGLPQPCIEVSAMYYDYKFHQLPPYQQHANADIDLRLSTLMRDLELPERDAHDAVNDAVMAALAFIKLKHLRSS
ncbi:DNA polymerase-3 subunit epsilon [Acidovorax sp. 56]|uniref:3'-5' exonuclease n=1 Tax=Acidovorax sp. 56 TaxID=2035205 RepID=UPI000C16CAE3|nr:3'-5' exonuclease [Acidovorax sp. 56]PIF27408.1 DNA polymerase-3 subunit epsilon [Acidovorax sp. 56]